MAATWLWSRGWRRCLHLCFQTVSLGTDLDRWWQPASTMLNGSTSWNSHPCEPLPHSLHDGWFVWPVDSAEVILSLLRLGPVRCCGFHLGASISRSPTPSPLPPPTLCLSLFLSISLTLSLPFPLLSWILSFVEAGGHVLRSPVERPHAKEPLPQSLEWAWLQVLVLLWSLHDCTVPSAWLTLPAGKCLGSCKSWRHLLIDPPIEWTADHE